MSDEAESAVSKPTPHPPHSQLAHHEGNVEHALTGASLPGILTDMEKVSYKAFVAAKLAELFP